MILAGFAADKGVGKAAKLSKYGELMQSNKLLAKTIAYGKGRTTVFTAAAKDVFVRGGEVKGLIYKKTSVLSLGSTAKAVKNAGIALTEDFADLGGYVNVLNKLGNKGNAYLSVSLKKAADKGFDTTKYAKWPKEVVQEAQDNIDSLSKSRLDEIDTKITALNDVDSDLTAKLGIKTISEADHADLLIQKYGSSALKAMTKEEFSVSLLTKKYPALTEKLAASTKLSGAENLKKVAELERRYSGMGEKVGELSSIDGISDTVNRLYSAKINNFIKGHRFEIEKAYQLKTSGENLVSMEETFSGLKSGVLRVDLISKGADDIQIATEFKNWNRLKLTRDTKNQLDKLKELTGTNPRIKKARIISKGSDIAPEYLQYAGSKSIPVFDESMNLLNSAYLTP